MFQTTDLRRGRPITHAIRPHQLIAGRYFGRTRTGRQIARETDGREEVWFFKGRGRGGEQGFPDRLRPVPENIS